MTTNPQPKASPFEITPLPVGAVRVTVEGLQSEEVRHACLVRDFDPATIRRMCIDLLIACEEAERMRASIDEDDRR